MQADQRAVMNGTSNARPGGEVALERQNYLHAKREYRNYVQPLTAAMSLVLRTAGYVCPDTLRTPCLMQVRERRREMVLVLSGTDTTTHRQTLVWCRVPKWLGRKIMKMCPLYHDMLRAQQRQLRASRGKTTQQPSRGQSNGSRVIRRRIRRTLG